MHPRSSANGSPFLRHNPLVPAAALFLAGVTLGAYCHISPPLSLAISATALLAWLAAEITLTGYFRLALTHASLALAILAAGTSLWLLNQHSVETNHIARFTQADPIPITARLRVLAPPDNAPTHGNRFWIASATELYTGSGWIPAAGDLRIQWRAADFAPALHRGQIVQIYGYLHRPDPALNPGAMDPQKLLAADRIFAEIRIPRANSLIILEDSPASRSPLTTLRTFLRAKLLEHTARIDVEAGYSMVALLLGRRDPIIEPVSQAFADAGVAHLLAISGAHIVFFTAMVWALLRFIPLRPRWRDSLIALIVLAYVLATPCGPPVIRAAIALSMLLISRLLGRPRQFLNMLAAAAILVILFRPSDLFDAGFQLSFICTACLVLFAERLHTRLFSRLLARQQMIADLAATRYARLKLRIIETILALLTANVIGATAAAPLVAFHFGRINSYAMLTGLIALPIVALTMAASALQLLLELISTNLAALAAPFLTFIGHLMVWIVEHLAAIPGAAIALRAPPPWLIALMYAVILLAIARRRLALTRALVINAALAVLTLTAAWYLFTQPRGDLQITTLAVGQGSSVLIRTPNGSLWLINAGSRDTSNLVHRAISPALQQAGAKNLDAMFITALDTLSAQSAAEAIDQYQPPLVMTSSIEWQHLGWTHTGAAIEQSLSTHHLRHFDLTAGSTLDAGQGAHLRILWPPPDPAIAPLKPRDSSIENPKSKIENPRAPLALLFEYAHRKILLLDPANLPALVQSPDLHCDAIIFLGPQRSATADAPLRKLLATITPQTIIWNSRTTWAPHENPPNELNTLAGAITLRITPDGNLSRN